MKMLLPRKTRSGQQRGKRACGSSACIHIHANVCAVVTTGVPIRGWACACDTHFYGDRCQFGCVPVRETAVLGPFYTTNDGFAKTGSGQTYETLRKNDAFLLQDKSCSGHGQCDSVFGTCVCNTNFFGEDCSVRKTPFWSNLYVFE